MGSGLAGLAVVILAAGKGTRMKSSRAKVLHEIAGRPLLGYPVAMAQALRPERLVVVIGRDADLVRERFEGRARFVLQAEQKGTGHAVRLGEVTDSGGDAAGVCGAGVSADRGRGGVRSGRASGAWPGSKTAGFEIIEERLKRLCLQDRLANRRATGEPPDAIPKSCVP